MSQATKSYFAYHNPYTANLLIYNPWDGVSAVLDHTFTCSSNVFDHTKIGNLEKVMIACEDSLHAFNLDTKATEQTYDTDASIHNYRWVTEVTPEGEYFLVDYVSYTWYKHMRYNFITNTLTEIGDTFV